MISKKAVLTIFAIVLLSFTSREQYIVRLDKKKISYAGLDRKIESLMKAANVQGLAISIFNNNETVYKKRLVIKMLKQKNLLKRRLIFTGLH